MSMGQLQLQLLGRLDAPSLVPHVEILKIKTYREAVRMCWAFRRVQSMTKSRLCEETGMRASHATDYLSSDTFDRHGREVRDMPAKYVPAMERVAGNTFITQWLALQSKLTVLELVLATRQVAA
jgi:hypothetical protein